MGALSTIETNIKMGDAKLEKAEHYETKREEMRISAGKDYLAARELTYRTSADTGLGWLDALDRFSTRSRQDVAKVMKIAASSDPHAALETERKETAQRVAKHREKASNDAYNDDVRVISPEEPVDLGVWVAPEREVDPVDGLMLRVDELTREEFVRFINRVTERARQLGLLDR